MIRAVVAALALAGALAAGPAAARAEAPHPWYRGFYTRVGLRAPFGFQESIHAWPAPSFGLGHRLDRGTWGLDVSVLNFQLDIEEGTHTVVRVMPYLALGRERAVDAWFGAGLSYGWTQGTVDEPLAKRRGYGLQGELAAGIELPRALPVRAFAQAACTAPFYFLYDVYRSGDSRLYIVSLEAALGVRF